LDVKHDDWDHHHLIFHFSLAQSVLYTDCPAQGAAPSVTQYFIRDTTTTYLVISDTMSLSATPSSVTPSRHLTSSCSMHQSPHLHQPHPIASNPCPIIARTQVYTHHVPSSRSLFIAHKNLAFINATVLLTRLENCIINLPQQPCNSHLAHVRLWRGFLPDYKTVSLVSWSTGPLQPFQTHDSAHISHPALIATGMPIRRSTTSC
jgi:hypothetical protein